MGKPTSWHRKRETPGSPGQRAGSRRRCAWRGGGLRGRERVFKQDGQGRTQVPEESRCTGPRAGARRGGRPLRASHLRLAPDTELLFASKTQAPWAPGGGRSGTRPGALNKVTNRKKTEASRGRGKSREQVGRLRLCICFIFLRPLGSASLLPLLISRGRRRGLSPSAPRTPGPGSWNSLGGAEPCPAQRAAVLAPATSKAARAGTSFPGPISRPGPGPSLSCRHHNSFISLIFQSVG